MAPSPIPFSPESTTPHELAEADIKKVVDDFRSACRRAMAAGFDIIEIHAAHGYLINQFMSPLSNHRHDLYGGSFENRIHLLIEIVEAIRSETPDGIPLFVRISSVDWTDEGWILDDSIKLARILKLRGVDLIDCSSGGVIPGVKIPVAPGYQVPFAESIRREAGILTGAVGIIVSAMQAETILERQQADLILMARELLRDPYFPLRAARELDHDVDWPVQYLRAKRIKK